MKQYLKLMRKILDCGIDQQDGRTGHTSRQLFGETLKFHMWKGFPAVTTKKLFFKGIIHELIWFLSGDCENIKYLRDNDVHIWDAWADDDGFVGPIYGAQWRRWENLKYSYTEDQIKQLIDGLRENPLSRRHIVSAWNVSDLEDMALVPCHILFQCHVAGKLLHMTMYQRSADMFLGVPFNIASYAILLHMIAAQTDLVPGTLTMMFGNVHLYENQFAAAREQVSRKYLALPQLILRPAQSIDDYTADHVRISGYNCHPAIKVPVVV